MIWLIILPIFLVCLVLFFGRAFPLKIDEDESDAPASHGRREGGSPPES
jgi:hypothetical protein